LVAVTLASRGRLSDRSSWWWQQPRATTSTPIPPAAAGALRFLSAAIDQGMGSFHLAPGFSLVLPAGSTGSIYSAAVLLDIATGP
jgi:hypothetical protein